VSTWEVQPGCAKGSAASGGSYVIQALPGVCTIESLCVRGRTGGIAVLPCSCCACRGTAVVKHSCTFHVCWSLAYE
jgi:hypothetical protein